MENKNFVMIANEIARSPRVSARCAKVYAFLKSYNPCHPSLDHIHEKTGLAKGTIRKAIVEATRLGLLTYIQGDRTRSNLYKMLPESEWRLHEVDESKTNRRSNSVLNGSKTCLQGRANIDPVVGQNLDCNKTKSKKTNLKQTKEKDQTRTIKGMAAEFDSDCLTWFAETLRSQYGEFHLRFYGSKYPEKYGSDFHDHNMMSMIVSESIRLSSHGGTLYCWVKSEFERLQNKRERRTPVPRFLINKDSTDVYLTKINCEVRDNSIFRCVAPLDVRHLKTVTALDKTYQMVARSIDEFIKVESIESYERQRIQSRREDILQMGPHLFKYATLKQFITVGTVLPSTAKGWELYCQRIGTNCSFPFFNEVFEGTENFEFEKRGISQGCISQAEFEYSVAHLPVSKGRETNVGRDGNHGQVRGHEANEIEHDRRLL